MAIRDHMATRHRIYHTCHHRAISIRRSGSHTYRTFRHRAITIRRSGSLSRPSSTTKPSGEARRHPSQHQRTVRQSY